MKRRIRRILIGIVALVAVIAIAGGVYESVAHRRAVREFPAPGKLVDVGDERRIRSTAAAPDRRRWCLCRGWITLDR